MTRKDIPLYVIALLLITCSIKPPKLTSGSAKAGSSPFQDRLRKHLLFESTFEDAASLENWRGLECTSAKAIRLTRKVARDGRYAVRFEINKTDALLSGGRRAELALGSEEEPRVERWYAASILLPRSYAADPEPEGVMQWHVMPDTALGEDWRSPPILLMTKNGRWILAIQWAAAAVNTNATIDGWKHLDLGPCTTGDWTDWVFRMRFSWQEDGFIKVWKNDQLVATYTGPNIYNDKNGLYLKVGLYKSRWESAVNQRVLYYDEIRIGKPQATYQHVQPGT